ncbi:MAG: DUF1559 domain-containing protein [Pirellulaceae bacterium]
MSRSRQGFTLIELLVVIAIIGILVGFLLPAVQMVREAARRTQCKNNLKQMGLSLQAFHDVRNFYPSGWMANTDAGVPGWGWMTQALPFIEQTPIYEQIDFSKRIEHAQHDAVRDHRLQFMLCPSSTQADMRTVSLPNGGYDDPYAPINLPIDVPRAQYVGCVGTTVGEEEMDNGEFCPRLTEISGGDETMDGIFYRNSRVRLEHVYDGTSNSIAVGERSGRVFESTWIGVVHGTQYPCWRVVAWTGEPPNNKPFSSVHFHYYAQFNSAHSGLTNFSLLDGSVQTIADTIDPDVFKAMGTVSGAEVPRPIDN